jgi:phenylalanyl-tRNA synthetase beta chain
LQAIVVDALRAAEIAPPSWCELDRERPAWAHQVVALAGGWPEAPDAIAVAALEPRLARALGLTGELESEVALALVALDALERAPRRAAGYVPVPRYPGVKVDVALALPAEVRAAQAAGAIEAAGKGLVAGLELFDLYAGAQVGAGRKSLAYHVLLQSAKATLTEKDVARFLERLARGAEELGGELRRA